MSDLKRFWIKIIKTLTKNKRAFFVEKRIKPTFVSSPLIDLLRQNTRFGPIKEQLTN